MLYHTTRSLFTLSIFAIFFNVYSQLIIKVDTVYIEKANPQHTIYADSCDYLTVIWRICNSGKTVENFNPPWYLYPEAVVSDSCYLGRYDVDSLFNNIALAKGIGNTRAKIFVNDKQIAGCLHKGYVTGDITDGTRVKIKSGECLKGGISFAFNLAGIDSVCNVVFEYNSIFQTVDTKDLWRGRLISEPYRLYLKSECLSK